MGILSWILGSALALVACRFIPLGRPASRLPEMLSGIALALAGGLVATRLDFGGWNEADPRAALFCAVATISGVALARGAVVLLSPRAEARRSK